MRRLEADAAGIQKQVCEVDSGEVRVTGRTDATRVDGVYGHFDEDSEVLEARTGTLRLRGLARGHEHVLGVGVGSIDLYAGELLSLVSAQVQQGVISGTYLGRLERYGNGGWRLYPAEEVAGTSVQCSVE